MSRLQRFVSTISWGSAVVEAVLIAFGILLALQFENWNDARKDRSREVIVLRELRTALKSDLSDIELNLKIHREGVRSASVVLNVLEEGETLSDSLNSHFGRLLNASFLVENRGPYETLRAGGLDLLSDDSLRAATAKLYEFQYQAIQKLEQIDEHYLKRHVLPYYLEHFDDIEIFRTAAPRNTKIISGDPRFRAIVQVRLDHKKRYILPRYEALHGQVVGLISAIETNLPA